MNLRTVKKKTKSVSNVRKITKAMQLVSAFKMKRAQQAAIEGKPFQEELEKIIDKVIQKVNPSYSVLISRPVLTVNSGRDLAVIISSNKGLCGGYNFNLFNYVVKNIDLKTTDFVILGKTGGFFIYKLGGKIIADFSSTNPISSVSAIFSLILDNFLAGNYSNIFVLYNKFISTLKFEPTKQILLPLMYKKINNEDEKINKQYIIEPSAKEIIDPLLRSFVEEKIRYAIIESDASEHSARMMAMKNATDNANDVIYNLTLLSNRLRQEKITGELLDMVTAKESVEND